MKYIHMPKCRYSHEKMTVGFETDEIYLKVATDIFQVEGVEKKTPSKNKEVNLKTNNENFYLPKVTNYLHFF